MQAFKPTRVKKRIGAEELLELLRQEAAEEPRCRQVDVRSILRVADATGPNWTAIIQASGTGQESANAIGSILARLGAEYELK